MARQVGRAATAAVVVLACVAVFAAAAGAAVVRGYPSWPGANGKIVIAIDPPGNSNHESVFTIATDGSNFTEVYEDPRYGNAWGMSPSGNVILSGSRTACNQDTLLGVMTAVMTFATLLDTPTGAMCDTLDTDAAYSYDGSKIAFLRNGPGAGVWVMRADGSHQRRIYAGSGVSDLRWAPNNAFVSFAVGGSTYRADANYIPISVDPVPQSFYPVQPGQPGGLDTPVISPDGTKQAYLHCCYPDTGLIAQVVVANADGTNPQRISTITYETLCSIYRFCDGTGGYVVQVLWQSAPTTPTVGQIRSELQAMRTAPLSFWARFYLDRSIQSTGWADAPGCWSSDGTLAATQAGYSCLQALRITLLRLYYANGELRRATLPQRQELVSLISHFAYHRFISVDAAQPVDEYRWRASGTTAPLWSARRDLEIADGNDDNRIEATIPYIRSWKRLINFPSVAVPSS